MIGLGGYTDYGKKADKKKGKGNGREEAKILRKRKQDDRWGRDGGKGGEGHEREIEGNRQRERVTWNSHSVGKTELFMENQF